MTTGTTASAREALTEQLAVAADLRRIANHISETLYFCNDAIHKSYTLADQKCIRHDDYDRLRSIAADIERSEYLRLAADLKP